MPVQGHSPDFFPGASGWINRQDGHLIAERTCRTVSVTQRKKLLWAMREREEQPRFHRYHLQDPFPPRSRRRKPREPASRPIECNAHERETPSHLEGDTAKHLQTTSEPSREGVKY